MDIHSDNLGLSPGTITATRAWSELLTKRTSNVTVILQWGAFGCSAFWGIRWEVQPAPKYTNDSHCELGRWSVIELCNFLDANERFGSVLGTGGCGIFRST